MVFGFEKTKPNKANLSFTAENAEIAELINIISSVSVVLANSAVDLKKQSQFIRIEYRVMRIAERKKAKMRANLEFIRVYSWLI